MNTQKINGDRFMKRDFPICVVYGLCLVCLWVVWAYMYESETHDQNLHTEYTNSTITCILIGLSV